MVSGGESGGAHGPAIAAARVPGADRGAGDRSEADARTRVPARSAAEAVAGGEAGGGAAVARG
uniref:Uncharacterized protein n=1 Tax=Arundo donax TaxID=35708 RepID=A0A0A9TKR0_ARUDO